MTPGKLLHLPEPLFPYIYWVRQKVQVFPEASMEKPKQTFGQPNILGKIISSLQDCCEGKR